MFYTLSEFLENTEHVLHDDNIKSKTINELQFIRCELAKQFPNISRDDLAFVRHTYLVVVVGYPILQRNGGMAEDHGGPEARQLPRVWTRGRKEIESRQRVSGAKSP